MKCNHPGRKIEHCKHPPAGAFLIIMLLRKYSLVPFEIFNLSFYFLETSACCCFTAWASYFQYCLLLSCYFCWFWFMVSRLLICLLIFLWTPGWCWFPAERIFVYFWEALEDIHSQGHRSANFFCTGPDSKCCRLWGP